MTELVLLENPYPTEKVNDDKTVVTQVKAKWEFDAVAEGQISFPIGAIIDVTLQYTVEQGWWVGKYEEQEGLFPINRTEVYQVERPIYKKILLRTDSVSDKIRMLQNQIGKIHAEDEISSVSAPAVLAVAPETTENKKPTIILDKDSSEESSSSHKGKKANFVVNFATGELEEVPEPSKENSHESSSSKKSKSSSESSSDVSESSESESDEIGDIEKTDSSQQSKSDKSEEPIPEIKPEEVQEPSKSEESKKSKSSESESGKSDYSDIRKSQDSSKDDTPVLVGITLEKKSEPEDVGLFLEKQAKDAHDAISADEQTSADTFVDDSDFWTAASNGNLDRIKKLIKEGQNVNQKNKQGETALHCASAGANYDVILYLLSHHANIGVLNNKQRMPHTQTGCTNSTRQVLLENLKDEPTWIPDSTSQNCLICSKGFTFFSRRHHCRNCGVLACGSCTAYKVPIPSIYKTPNPQRVCSFCHPIIVAHAK